MCAPVVWRLAPVCTGGQLSVVGMRCQPVACGCRCWWPAVCCWHVPVSCCFLPACAYSLLQLTSTGRQPVICHQRRPVACHMWQACAGLLPPVMGSAGIHLVVASTCWRHVPCGQLAGGLLNVARACWGPAASFQGARMTCLLLAALAGSLPPAASVRLQPDACRRCLLAACCNALAGAFGLWSVTGMGHWLAAHCCHVPADTRLSLAHTSALLPVVNLCRLTVACRQCMLVLCHLSVVHASGQPPFTGMLLPCHLLLTWDGCLLPVATHARGLLAVI